MTNAEAKNWLKKLFMRTDITDEYGDMEDMQPYEEAVNIAIKSLDIIDKIRGYVEHIRNTGLGKKKSLDFIEKYIDGLKESEDKE